MVEQERFLLNWLVRYRSVASCLQTLPRPESVLEVGCGLVGLACLYHHPFVGCDLHFEGVPYPTIRPAAGSALRLPFVDRAFSVVVCLDVLEHIAPDHRLSVVEELLRVARSRVVLGFPSSDAARRVDTWLAHWYRTLRRPTPDWLQEHQLWPLPDRSEVEDQLDALSLSYTWRVNAAWPLQLLIMLLDTTPLGHRLAGLARRYPRCMLTTLCWIDQSNVLGGLPQPYRLVYWIDREDSRRC